jgi:phosphopantothenoylcysteine decarboxylase/phosphopantothenate--cysteine ligase
MGIAIAEELASRGAKVNLVLGPSHLTVHHKNISIYNVETASDMYQQCIELFNNADAAIMSAAVADYKPAVAAKEKIKKNAENMVIELVKTRDILQSLGERKKNGQLLVGFALETANEREHALNKLLKKNADMIVLNSLSDTGAGFGHDTNKVTIFEKGGNELAYGQKTKQQVAKDIVDRLVKMLYV